MAKHHDAPWHVRGGDRAPKRRIRGGNACVCVNSACVCMRYWAKRNKLARVRIKEKGRGEWAGWLARAQG